MDDDRRKLYRGIGYAFIAIGVAVMGGYIAQLALGFNFFSGDPSSVGLFLSLIGATLVYTVRRRRKDTEEDSSDPESNPD